MADKLKKFAIILMMPILIMGYFFGVYNFSQKEIEVTEVSKFIQAYSSAKFVAEYDLEEEDAIIETTKVTSLLSSTQGYLSAKIENQFVTFSFSNASAKLQASKDAIYVLGEAFTSNNEILVIGTKLKVIENANLTNFMAAQSKNAEILTMVSGIIELSNFSSTGDANCRAVDVRGGKLTLDTVSLSGYAETNGGAVINAGTLEVVNSTLSQNSATLGGAIYNSGTLSVSSSSITNNTTDNIYNVGTMQLSDNTITSAADTYSINNHGTLSLEDDNTISGSVAGIYLDENHFINLDAMIEETVTVYKQNITMFDNGDYPTCLIAYSEDEELLANGLEKIIIVNLPSNMEIDYIEEKENYIVSLSTIKNFVTLNVEGVNIDTIKVRPFQNVESRIPYIDTTKAKTNDEYTCGWYINSSYTTPANFSQQLTEDITLYTKIATPNKIQLGSSVRGNASSVGEIVIPVKYKSGQYSYTITSVDGYTSSDGSSGNSGRGFNSRTSVTKIYLSTSITSLGTYYGATNLQYINITDNITSIAAGAFYNTKLQNVYGKNVTNMGQRAFNSCTSLVSAEFPSITTISGMAFYGCSSLETVEFASATTVGSRAFYGCSSLENVTFSENLATINDYGFYNCSSLESIDADNVTRVDSYAFYGAGLTTLRFPRLTTFVSYAFSNMPYLTEVDEYSFPVLTSITRSNIDYLNEQTFSNMPLLESIRFPALTTLDCTIGSSCPNLETATFDAMQTVSVFVNSKGSSYMNGNSYYSPFSTTSSIKKYYFPVLTSLPNYCFYSWNNIAIQEFHAPLLQTVGTYAFSRTSNLRVVEFGSALQSIGNNAFQNSGITNIDLTGTSTTIGNYAFADCTSLISANLGSATSLGQYAFSGDRALTTVVTGNALQTISTQAFYNCTALNNLTIGTSVQTIDSGAFQGDTGLTSLTLPASMRTISGNAFYGCTGLVTANLGGTQEIGGQAFYNCTNLTTITFKAGKFGSSCFGSCSKLVNLYYTETLNNWIANSSLTGANYGNLLTSSTRVLYIQNQRLSGTLTIPSTVTAIGPYCFIYQSGITETTIPANITSVGSYAFAYCTGLTDIVLSDATYGTAAFKGCSGLITCDISALSSVPNELFSECAKLSMVTFKSSIVTGRPFKTCPNLKHFNFNGTWQQYAIESLREGNNFYGLYPFGSTTDIGYLYVNGKLITGSVTIPDGITRLGSAMFCFSDITSLNLNEVEEISGQLLYYCNKLTSIVVPNVTDFLDGLLGSASNVTSLTLSKVRVCPDINGLVSKLTTLTLPVAEEIDANNFRASRLTNLNVTDNPNFVKVGNAVYTADMKTLVYIQGSTRPSSFEMPASVNKIGGAVFYSFNGITSLNLENIQSVGDYAFYQCTSLTSANLATTGGDVSGAQIGNYAFYGCSSLQSANIPTGINKIGDYAFYNCTQLASSITVSASCQSIGNYAFSNCNLISGLTFAPNGQLQTIGSYAFSGNSNPSNAIATAIVLPDTTESIGTYAFQNSSLLPSVTIGSSLSTISGSAFNGCTNLGEVTIKNASIYAAITSNTACGNLITNAANIYVLASIDDGSNTYLSSNFNKVVVGSYNLYTRDAIIYGNWNTTNKTADVIGATGVSGEVTIASTVTYNGEQYTVTGIASNSFVNKTSITKVNIPDTVTYIGNYAFDGCTGLIEINIPAGMTSYFGSYAFRNCTHLEIIRFNATNMAGTSNLNIYPFYYTGINGSGVTVYIGANVTKLSTRLFYTNSSGFEGLKKVVIAEGSVLTTIEDNAFDNCRNLTEINIPSTVTSMGANVFNYCKLLSKVIIDSPYVYQNLTTNTALGGLIYYAADIFVAKSADNSTNTYLLNEFTKVVYDNNYNLYMQSPFIYSYSGTNATITGCRVGSGSLVIPSTTTNNGTTYNVTAIAAGSTSDGPFLKKGISSITIASSITSIGNYAFYGCPNLQTVIFAADSNLTTIGSYAFQNCSSLQHITIPSKVTSIGAYAFNDCVSLESLNFNATNCSNMSQSGTFSNAGKNSSGIVMNVGANVTKIPAYFAYTTSSSVRPKFVSVSFDSGSVCTSIGDYAFAYVRALTQITLPSGMKTLGSNFVRETGITSITIPASVTSLGSYSFCWCQSLQTIDFEVNSQCTTFGSYALHGCTDLRNLTVPEKITTFTNQLDVGSSTTSAVGLQKLEVLNWRVTTLSTYSAEKCFSWAGTQGNGFAVNIAANVTSIVNGFMNIGYPDRSPKITSVNFAANSACKTIGQNAFYAQATGFVSYITSVDIPEACTSIGNNAFMNSQNLTTINMRATSLADFGANNNIFYRSGQNGNGITINVAANVTRIPAYFMCANSDYGYHTYIPNVKSVVFASNSAVTTIGGSAFWWCNNLTNFKFEELANLTTIGASAFYYCESIPNIKLPQNATIATISTSAFSNCSSATIINVPTAVTSIQSGAFSGCRKLQTLNYYATTVSDFSSSYNVFLYCGQDNANGFAMNISANVTKIPAYMFYYSNNYSGTSTEYVAKVKTVNFAANSACTSIGNYAFHGCASLTSITIPAGVTAINQYAFEYCSNLVASFASGSACTTISNYAFAYALIGNITIPATVTSFADYAFYHSGVQNVIFENNARITSLGQYCFEGSANLESINIPETVVTLNFRCFRECTSLKTAIMPTSLTSRYNSVYYGCTGLETINYNITNYANFSVPNSTSSSYNNYIFFGAGRNSSGVTLNIAANVTRIPASMFFPQYGTTNAYCNIKTINFAENSVCTSIGASAFQECQWLETINIPSTITSIGNQAFYNCFNVQTLNYDASISADFASGYSSPFYNLGASAQNGFTLNIGANTTILPKYFMEAAATGLVAVNIDANSQLQTIGERAFYYCRNIATPITIPATVTTIGNYAFEVCEKIPVINFNATNMNDITSYSNNIFHNVGKLTNGVILNIGANVTKIPTYLFNPYGGNTSYSPKITEVKFAAGSVCESIGANAFAGNMYLSKINLPASITSIGANAFTNCVNVSEITVDSDYVYTNLSASANFYTLFQTASKIYVNKTIDAGSNSYLNDNFTKSSFNANYNLYESDLYTYSYDTTNKTASITGAKSLSGNIVIPSTTIYNGETYAVTAIAAGNQNSSPFKSKIGITTLTIPASITSIGNYAFYQCSGLTKVTFEQGSNISSFGQNVFNSCTSLEEVVNFGGAFTTIPSGLFASCSSLETITIPSNITIIASSAFSSCTVLDNITLPNGLVEIQASAFYMCYGLTSITIPASVTTLGSSVFSSCRAMETVTFAAGSSITTLPSSGFYSCGSLVSINIPSTVTTIYDSVFSNCTVLANVTIPSGVTSIGGNVFYQCRALASITIPAGVSSIASSLFYYCTSLTTVTFASGSVCTTIGSSAFYYCTSLESINIPSGVTTIGPSAFNGCSKLASITLPSGLTSLGGSTFSGCSKLESITIPAGVTTLQANTFYGSGLQAVYFASNNTLTSIGNQAFDYCRNLASITIPTSVTSIGTYAFRTCAFESITIPSGVVSIGQETFSSCPNLRIVTFANGSVCTSIGNNAFSSCTSLESINIPSGVATIGQSAFYNCTSLASITLPSGLTSIETSVFQSCSSLASITIPSGVTTIGATAFYYCTSLASITIPSGVTSIGANAFYNCTSLASISIPANITTIGNNAFYSCANLIEVTILSSSIYSNTTSTSTNGYLISSAINIYVPVSIDDGSNTFLTGNYTKTTGETYNMYSVEPFVFSYNTSAKTATLTQVRAISATMEIPSTVLYNGQNYTVTAIAASTNNNASTAVFGNKTNLVRIVLPNTLQTIGSYAFSGCTNLTYVNIPTSITGIGNYAFYNCTHLETIDFNATNMGDLTTTNSSSNYVFYNAGIEGSGIAFNVGANVTKIPAALFYPVYSQYANAPKITSINWAANSVCTTIGNHAFYGCTYLQTLTIPASIKTMVKSVFCYAFNLRTLNFNATNMTDLTSYNYVFEYAGRDSGGFNITVGANVTKIPAYLFCPYTTTTDAAFVNNVVFEQNSACTTIGSYAFSYSSITSIVMPNSVTTIDSYAFQYCYGLQSVTIPESVTAMGSYVFSYCSNLRTINYNAANITNPNYFGSYPLFYAAGSAQNLITVNIGARVANIPTSLFSSGGNSTYSPKIGTVNFAANGVCTTIGTNAFYGCVTLTSITIPASVTTISQNAFYGCTGLIALSFATNCQLTSIEQYAFYNCTSLTSVSFPSNLQSIGPYAFYNCASLESIRIPSSVVVMGYDSFKYCSNLSSAIFDVTEGWFVTTNSSATSGTEVAILNPMINATNLQKIYIGSNSGSGYYWKRTII